MFNSRASVLFDTGASHSFISSAFTSALDLEVDRLGSTLTVDTLVGGLVSLGRVCRNCEIIISDQNLRVDFIIIDMTSSMLYLVWIGLAPIGRLLTIFGEELLFLLHQERLVFLLGIV